MIADLRVGDYIEKSELDTEQKYNDVVEVFESFGFKFEKGAICGFDMLKVNSAIVLSCNIVFICLDSELMDRKLTYREIMSLKKDNDECFIEDPTAKQILKTAKAVLAMESLGHEWDEEKGKWFRKEYFN